MIMYGLHSASILIMMMHRSDDDFAAGTSLASVLLHQSQGARSRQATIRREQPQVNLSRNS